MKEAGLGKVHLPPHRLWASFVTLALEKGAKLEQVQYDWATPTRAAERYQQRKLNLKNYTVDFIKIS
jgi:hypothetical protein